MIKYQNKLLKATKKVSKADAAESINQVMENINKHLTKHSQKDEMRTLTLGFLKETNERLWFTTCMGLGKSMMEEGGAANFESLDRMILEMKGTCKLAGASVHDNSKSTFDESKGNTLLEIFALEIQAYTIRKETKKMRAVYHLSENFTGVIDDPRVLAIIKESGAKMYMSEKRWELAMEAFFNAFCRAVECGS
jgi:COP9 signalosome complex subunit 2